TSPKQYTGLTAGTYTWVVKDANGCEKSGSETITQPDELLASDGHTNVSCFGGSNGSVTVTFSGGTAPYEVNFNGGGFASQTSPKQYTGLTAGTYTWVVKDANGCEKSGSETITQPNALTCNLTTPSIPSCGTIGSTVSGTVSGGTGPYTCSASFDAAGVNAGWSVTNCTVVGGAITVTYTSGGVANTVLTVTVTDANNCTSTCTVTLTCDGGKGCTPGFWKTHPEVWDNCSDLVVQAIPGASCNGTGTSGNFTPGADFTTSTPFVAYFGITNICTGGCKLANLPSTMGAAMSAGGGDCKKLARTGVAALLNAAVFGSDYLDATGFATYADLYNAIKNGFNTCTYEPLATNLDNANNQDHSLCSGLPRTILTSSIVNTRINPDNGITLNVSKELTVQAYPNPFSSEINFRFVSPVSGYANLEVYDMVGRKLSIVYSGSVDANIPRTVTYRVPATQHVPMLYKLNVGGKSVIGKLLPGDKGSYYEPKPKP
ncbi:MAG: hypothetical protein GXC73_04775, partial [Chitinophagaceae bacterium]|nr:hypothetical protein [Chitinophagaceae bacterium]